MGVLSEPVPPRARLAERWIALLFGAAVLLGSQLPVLWAWRAQWKGYHPHLVFSGALHTYAEETATYLGWMEQAREGRFVFIDRLTHEPHPRQYVNVLFAGMGWIARLGGMSVTTVYALARPVLGALLLLLLYILAARLFDRPVERLVCFAFFVLSGGWEGLAELGGHLSSLVWWSPEVNTVFSLMVFPHFLAALAAIVGTILLMMSAWSEEDRTWRARVSLALGAGAVLAALTFFHPYDVVPLVGTLLLAPLLFAWWRGGTLARDLHLSGIAITLCTPAVLYNGWLFRHNPVFRSWDVQNPFPHASLVGLLIALGIGLPLAVLSLAALGRMGRPLLVLWAWFPAVLVGSYLPLRFQRKLLAGVQYPLGGLAAAGLFLVLLPALARGKRRAPLWAAALLALVLVPAYGATPYYLWRNEWARLRRCTFPCWLPAPLVAALGDLAGRPGPEAVVAASYDTGNLVPYMTGKRCVLGHYALTVESRRREAELARLFTENPTDDPWRRATLQSWGARYLVQGPYERALGGFDPASRPWLRLLRVEGRGEDGETAIYEVSRYP